MQAFSFQGAKEVFHGRIIIETTRTRRWGAKLFFVRVKVCLRRVLRPLVTMEGKSITALFLLQSITDRICNQRSAYIISKSSSENSSAIQSQNSVHATYSLWSANGCDSRYPETIRKCLFKLTSKKSRIFVNILHVMCIHLCASEL